MSDLDRIVERLTWLLRLSSRGGIRAHRMTYTALPLSTELKFEGVPLRSIMSPPAPEDPYECEHVFDTWLSPLVTGEGDQRRDLIEVSGTSMLKFIEHVGAGRTVSLAEMTVRLLYALGNGAETDITTDRFMVSRGDRSFGIDHGHVVSRFCSGLELGEVNPQAMLSGRDQIRTFDRDFCVLYREAYRRGKGTAEALIALHMGQPGFDFSAMANANMRIKPPTRAQFQRWEAVLCSDKDPIAKLYKQLVPKWMTAGEFSTTFCPLPKRPLELGPRLRQTCLTQLHNFFHNKKNNRIEL